MNPDSSKFYEVDDSANPKKGTVKTVEAKEKGWPIFEIGEVIPIKDHLFEILHIKYSSGRMVLRPLPNKITGAHDE